MTTMNQASERATKGATKRPEGVIAGAPLHWVGDGFPVRTLITPERSSRFSPYLLLDSAGPADFPPADEPRGVDTHPHRGFETVTLVFQGELEHRDSSGQSGRIGPGEVQWMTAGAGILHEEKHSRDFTRRGGTLEMVQLWVNLPRRHKDARPRYQALSAGAIPVVERDGALVRLVAGDLDGVRGAAETFTEVILWDVRLRAGEAVELPIAEGHGAAVYVRAGEVVLEGGARAGPASLVPFARAGSGLALRAGAAADAHLLVLGGEPIDEPIAAYGPFVMTSADELRAAFADLRAGRFGRLD